MKDYKITVIQDLYPVSNSVNSSKKWLIIFIIVIVIVIIVLHSYLIVCRRKEQCIINLITKTDDKHISYNRLNYLQMKDIELELQFCERQKTELDIGTARAVEKNILKEKEYAARCYIHEAGHAIMAKINKLEVLYVEVNEVQAVTYIKENDGDVDAEYIKRYVTMLYSGAVAEELILGCHGTGSFISENSDFKRAVEMIKAYLVLSDSSLSKTLLDNELSERTVELSKKWYAEAKEVLTPRKEEIKELAELIQEKGKVAIK